MARPSIENTVSVSLHSIRYTCHSRASAVTPTASSTIRSPSLRGTVPQWIRDIKEIESVTVMDDTLVVTCDASVRLKVLTSLKEKGLDVEDFKTVDPSLEEAFVRLLTDKEGS